MESGGIPPKLADLLKSFDMYGQPGVAWNRPRANLLLGDVQFHDTDGECSLTGRQMLVEGSSKEMFAFHAFPMMPDTFCGDTILVASERRFDDPQAGRQGSFVGPEG